MSCDKETNPASNGPLECFNRPKAISCLATRIPTVHLPVGNPRFNRPKAISCLATQTDTPMEILRPRFNRPKAISCLATCRLWTCGSSKDRGFNRPKAISCLATRARPYNEFCVKLKAKYPLLEINQDSANRGGYNGFCSQEYPR